MSVDFLPEDCVKHILGLLNFSSQLRASTVCKYFQNIVKDSSFRVDLNLPTLLRNNPKLNQNLSIIVKSFQSRARRIVLPTLPMHKNPLTYSNLGRFPSADTIDLYGVNGAKLALEVLQNVCPLSVKQLRKLSLEPPRNSSLWDSDTVVICDYDMANSVIKVLPQFTMLSKVSVTVPTIDLTISLIESVPKLTHFDTVIKESGNIETLMKTLNNLENLEYLRLCIRGKTENSLEFSSQSCKMLSLGVVTKSSFVRCPQLEHLFVTCGGHLVLETPKLDTMAINASIAIVSTSDETSDSWNFPPSLRYLSMTNCKSIRQPHQVLPALARDCPALWYLSLQYCVLGEQLTIYPIAQLEVLDLSYHLEATGIVFDCRGSTSFDKLKKIDFSENIHLQKIEISGDVTKAFPCVAELHLSDVWRGDMDSFAEFMNQLPRLAFVAAEKMPAFMEEQIEAVKRGITIVGLRPDEEWRHARSRLQK